MQLTLKEIRRDRVLLPLPWPVARAVGTLGDLQAAALPIAPPLTTDQVELLKSDNIADPKAPGLGALGVTPTAVEPILPTYLYRYRPGGQFSEEAMVSGA
jgi:NADH dehydrogenase